MIDDFLILAWAEGHEKFSADAAAGLAHLARWLRRRAKAKGETPAVTSHRGKRRRTRPRAPPADTRPSAQSEFSYEAKYRPVGE